VRIRRLTLLPSAVTARSSMTSGASGHLNQSSSGEDLTVRYQTLRSVSDLHVFVVCHDDRFYELVPLEVRRQGPWQVNRRGEIEKLKPEYRLALARDGFALRGAVANISMDLSSPRLFRGRARHRQAHHREGRARVVGQPDVIRSTLSISRYSISTISAPARIVTNPR